MIFINPCSYKTYQKINSKLIDSIQKHVDVEETKNIIFTFYVRAIGSDIFMSHGCADKNYHIIDNCFHINKYDYIMVPGPWLKRKLIKNNIPKEKIYCVGWPKLDDLFELKKKKNNHTTILWAPSHSDQTNPCGKASSYPDFSKYFKKIKENNISIITNLHLYSQETKNQKITSNQYLEADYVVADFGSTIYESWALGIPVIFPDWIVKKNVIKYYKGSAEEYIYTNSIGLHVNNIDDLISVVKDDNNKTIDVKTKDFIEDYMPSKFNGKSGKTISKIIYEEILPKISLLTFSKWKRNIIVIYSVTFINTIILSENIDLVNGFISFLKKK